MSDAPRVELPNTDTDFDHLNGTTHVSEMDADMSSHSNNNTAQNLQNSAIKAKDGILEIALSASAQTPAFMNSHPQSSFPRNHMQNAKNTVMNGPVAQNVKAESAKTRDEFADLVDSRTVPDHKAATGQNLTHYHSMFYRLLSWKNPRATGIAFASTVVFIFATRYLNLIRYIFKASYMILGLTAAAEVAGQATIGRGLTSQFRPRQYFTIPKASLERMTDDLEQLVNFFVIESQRIVFAENVYVTVTAFFTSLLSYFLIKFVPLWGLALISTVITFLGPLVYIKNKDVIDAQLEKGYNIANQQAQQVKGLANQHAGNAMKTVQGYTQQATAKAQETVNQYRGRSASPEVKKADFPSAPKHAPVAESSDEEEDEEVPVAQPVA
ncbi:cell lysis [Pyrenophora seminiperda CCB06]|uniref:Reticulon-like protein n=1 Tax=Pyrenophora seminiperda CCB06 TaxID=1302712 RepID=A0A3M7MHL2_9PLEO|nr:cell lysis [Pyrenophora seminiperda CCB06]